MDQVHKDLQLLIDKVCKSCGYCSTDILTMSMIAKFRNDLFRYRWPNIQISDIDFYIYFFYYIRNSEWLNKEIKTLADITPSSILSDSPSSFISLYKQFLKDGNEW
jgi:hypothetical protein